MNFFISMLDLAPGADFIIYLSTIPALCKHTASYKLILTGGDHL